MSGPEHVRAAERLLNAETRTPTAGEVARAQVHATLAVALAQIETSTVDVSRGWSS